MIFALSHLTHFRGSWFRPFPTLIAALLVAAFSACSREKTEATEILWDTWGVPHVFASNEKELFHAFGWAQMASHGDLILRLYGEARGRAAEYWGPENLDLDRWVRTMGIPARAHEWTKAQEPEFRAYLDAFAAGMNVYAREHADRISPEVQVVLPVTGADILAHVQRVIHFTFVAGPQVVTAAERQWPRAGGSNAWAIAPSRSESGNALLLANPHLPWSGLFLFYEAQLVAPGMDTYGAALVGLPWLAIAFNDHLGWTHTVNTHDGQDLYELTLTADGYRWDGETRPFEIEEQTLKVKQPDGTLREEKLTVRRSVHGPVVLEKEGKVLALRVVGLDEPHLLEQGWEMGRATNLGEFQAALRRLQLPMFTVIYADRDGHILHLFGGHTPVRPQGSWNWSGIVAGDTSETLWTETHPYEDLPQVLDPPSGWLQNANDPPWTTTFPLALNPEDFPRYMAPRFMHFRAQRSARMLSEDDEISFEELVAYKHSTRMELADRLLDDLISAVQRSGNSRALRAAEVLQGWDRAADTGSRGAVLFQSFFEELRNRLRPNSNPFARPWTEASPRTTPDGLADPSAAVAALVAAARKVEATHGRLDVAWGEVYRLRRGDADLPANGGPGALGIFRVVGYSEDEDGRFRAVVGDSFVAAVEFSNPLRASVLIGYGNASQPGSPHLTDQLPLFSRKELRPAWRTRPEIEAHLESRKVF